MVSSVALYHVSSKGSIVVCREPNCSVSSVHLNQASAENVLNNNIFSRDEASAWFAMKEAAYKVSSSATERLSYEEMLEKAKLLHPEATVSNDNDEWVITIKPRVFQVDYMLPETYKGTPAWEAYNTESSGGESELERFGRKNLGWDLSISEIAIEYNIRCERQEWVKEKLVIFRAKNSLPLHDNWFLSDDAEAEYGANQVKAWARAVLAEKKKLEEESVLIFPSKG